MECTLPRTDLLRVVTHAAGACRHVKDQPILSHVLLRADATALRVTGSNLELSAAGSVAAHVSVPGSVCVDGQRIASLLKTLSGDVLMRATDKEQMELQSGRSTYRLTALKGGAYPKIPVPSDPLRTVSASTLQALLDSVQHACGRDKSRPQWESIGLEIAMQETGGGAGEAKTVAQAEATNGHRMALRRLQLDGAPLTGRILLPHESAAAIIRAIEDSRAKEVAIGFDDQRRHMFFQSASRGCALTLVTQLLSGVFPDLKQVIPTRRPIRARLNASALIAAIERARLIVSPTTSAVRLSFLTNELRLEVANPDKGTSTESLEASIDSAGFNVGLNVNYLLDFLKHLPSEDVAIEAAGELDPVLFRPWGEAYSSTLDHLGVVMPIRL